MSKAVHHIGIVERRFSKQGGFTYHMVEAWCFVLPRQIDWAREHERKMEAAVKKSRLLHNNPVAAAIGVPQVQARFVVAGTKYDEQVELCKDKCLVKDLRGEQLPKHLRKRTMALGDAEHSTELALAHKRKFGTMGAEGEQT